MDKFDEMCKGLAAHQQEYADNRAGFQRSEAPPADTYVCEWLGVDIEEVSYKDEKHFLIRNKLKVCFGENTANASRDYEFDGGFMHTAFPNTHSTLGGYAACFSGEDVPLITDAAHILAKVPKGTLIQLKVEHGVSKKSQKPFVNFVPLAVLEDDKEDD